MRTLDEVLGRWQKAIAEHRPEEVAALFTEDAVFQGLHPFSIGRPGVAAYYDAQPLAMTVSYRVIREWEQGGVTLGWIEAEFGFTDREPLPVNLTVVLRGDRIAHYHVSRAVPGDDRGVQGGREEAPSGIGD
jgi:hypothetical protein